MCKFLLLLYREAMQNKAADEHMQEPGMLLGGDRDSAAATASWARAWPVTPEGIPKVQASPMLGMVG